MFNFQFDYAYPGWQRKKEKCNNRTYENSCEDVKLELCSKVQRNETNEDDEWYAYYQVFKESNYNPGHDKAGFAPTRSCDKKNIEWYVYASHCKWEKCHARRHIFCVLQ